MQLLGQSKREAAVAETSLRPRWATFLFSVYIGTPVCTSQTLFLCGPNFTRRGQQVRQTLSNSGPNGLSGEGVQSFRGEGLRAAAVRGGRVNGKISAAKEIRLTVGLPFQCRSKLTLATPSTPARPFRKL